MFVPMEPKIYHIVHVDRLSHIVRDGYLWCDTRMVKHTETGTAIGITSIKLRRRTNKLNSHPSLQVGDCVPFYFCPRSVMLYVIRMANHPELEYKGGQQPIVHLEADLRQAVDWAKLNNRRWAFTTSNAGSSYFDDYSEFAQLDKIDWNAVLTNDWAAPEVKEAKQAEFLMEYSFPWGLVNRIGVYSSEIRGKVMQIIQRSSYYPSVEIKPGWYY